MVIDINNLIKKISNLCDKPEKGDILNIPIAIVINEEKRGQKETNAFLIIWKYIKLLFCCFKKTK